MAKRSSSPGIGLGAGVGAVAVNTCSSEDKSMFCRASRVFQIISWIFSTLVMHAVHTEIYLLSISITVDVYSMHFHILIS